MNEKIEKVTNRLIRLYSNGSAKAEAKFRANMHNFDWDKEERKLKSSLNVFRILFSIIFVLFILIFIVYVIEVAKQNHTISAGSSIAISISSIVILLNIQRLNQKYEALKLLRKLLGE